MLRITGSPRRYCDRISRRRFIEIGGLSVLGLSLTDLLRAEADAGPRRKQRSVILIWQHGGPSQLDTFDMKPDASSEIRGPYQPIRTSLPGLQICERMPFHAKVMDKCTVIRSFTHHNGDHWAAAHWLLTGRIGANGSDRIPQQPSLGAVASHLCGPRKGGVPASVNINDGGFGFHGAAWLGVAHNPFRIGDYSYGNEAGRLTTASSNSFTLVDSLSRQRLMNRVELMKQLDQLRRNVDARSEFANLEQINQQAQDIVLSGRAREAFDVSKEPDSIRELYGPGWGEQALLARRLVEAGVRLVTLNTGYWDDHGNIKGALDNKLPRHDRAVGTLITDLADRGILDDVLVVAAGEFGRTPKINNKQGRDHWPQAQSILLSGGGYRHGQVIGKTNDKAEHPISGAVNPTDFCAIIYHALGLKPTDTIRNLSGQPVHILPDGRVPRQLL